MADAMRPRGHEQPHFVHSILFFVGVPLGLYGVAVALNWLFALVG